MLLSNNGVSKVWREGDWVFKQQPKHLCDNEEHGLRMMYGQGFAPFAERIDISTVRMHWIPRDPVTDPEVFFGWKVHILEALRDIKLRHGDLTEYAIRILDNHPYIIDWAESRIWDDPRPDKRREGDAWWLDRTMRQLTSEVR